MRARLALASSGIQTELREIVLRDKPAAFLAVSASATVPCLSHEEGVIDESLDIMVWALEQNDPEHLLDMPALGHCLITEADGPFKTALDRYKYASRYDDVDISAELVTALAFLTRLEAKLNDAPWLFGDQPTLADLAILPFIRQFAHVDLDWFNAQALPNVQAWLEAFKSSPRFIDIMTKYPKWQPGDAPTAFP